MSDVRVPTPFQYLTGALVTLLLGPPIIALSLLGLAREAVYDMVRLWCRILHLVTRVRFRVQGLENVPAEGSYVVISNHCSHLDGPTLIRALPHPIYFVIKRELTRIPLWGQAVVKVGFIAIDRTDSDKARRQLRRAVDAVRYGRRVLVFAEGTRSRSDSMLPFKKGGFHLAVDAQVPILPVAVNGSRRLLPKGQAGARPGLIDVVVGTPIPTNGAGKDQVPELLDRTRAAITAMRRQDPAFPD
jgi:1-acyl-sn-glycerol-3-phosphate acyltransferase